MAWGRPAARGVDDLARRLESNDASLKSLTILRMRRLDEEDVELLSRALAGNTVLQELIACSHPLSVRSAQRLGACLALNRHLRHLSVGSSSFGDEALAALVEGGLHSNAALQVWDLEHKGLTHTAASSVGRVLQAHPSLQHLALSRNPLADAGLQQLCGSPWASLRQLELADCGITHEGLAALAAAPGVAGLSRLDLSDNPLGAAAAAGLGQLLLSASELQALRLKATGIGDAGARGIAGGLTAGAAAGLQLLDLGSTGLGGAGLSDLAAALPRFAASAAGPGRGAGGLQQLLLSGNPAVDDEAVCRLAQQLAAAAEAAAGAGPARGRQQQQQQQQQRLALDLGQTGVGAPGLQALAAVPGLSQLSLFGCKLGSGGVSSAAAALAAAIRSGGFAGLQELSLTGCGLGLEQLLELMAAAGAPGLLPQLAALELGANPGAAVGGDFEAAAAALREARPGVDVHWRVADSDEGAAPPPRGGAGSGGGGA